MAETTTQTRRPSRRAAATRSATLRTFSTSATDEPPYFWTTTFIAFLRRRSGRADPTTAPLCLTGPVANAIVGRAAHGGRG